MNNQRNLKRSLIKRALLFARTFTNKDGRVFLLRSQNKRLFKLLDEIQLFSFYTSNNGHLIGLSQIVAFLSYGWKALANGFTAHKDEIEVHHIDGDVQNNTPDNLVYLSRQDHQYISNCTYTPFYGKVKYDASTPFNRQGQPVTNKVHFLINILQTTISSVTFQRSGTSAKVNPFVILASLPKKLWKVATNFHQAPRWITTSLYHLFNPSTNKSYA